MEQGAILQSNHMWKYVHDTKAMSVAEKLY